MNNYSDYIGQTIHFLTIIRLEPRTTARQMTYAKVKCVCGVEKRAIMADIIRGKTKSCGCLSPKMNIERNTTHGLSKHPLMAVYGDMKDRCSNPNAHGFHHYGGRGISVCDEWVDDFKAFYDWCMSHGWEKGLKLDRFPDQNGDYSPYNCRITTQRENMRNMRRNVNIEFNGLRMCVSAWAQHLEIDRRTLNYRLINGWPIEKALTTPVKKRYGEDEQL